MPIAFADFVREEREGRREVLAMLRRHKGSCTGGLKLGKRIGTASLDAVVREASTDSGRQVACKTQKAKAWALNEVRLLDRLTRRALAGQIHLPVLFGSTRCDDEVSLFTQLMDGDLKMWFNERGVKRSASAFGSAAAQIALGFAQLHAAGIAHCDSHWGQVLFKRVKPGGVWFYKVGTRRLYVRNAGFVFKIWDLGQAGRLGKCQEYKNESRNVYYALGPFTEPDELGTEMRADAKTMSIAKHVAQLSRDLGVGSHKLVPKAYGLLLHLPGVSATKPRNAAVLNPTPMIIGVS